MGTQVGTQGVALLQVVGNVVGGGACGFGAAAGALHQGIGEPVVQCLAGIALGILQHHLGQQGGHRLGGRGVVWSAGDGCGGHGVFEGLERGFELT